LFSIYFGTNINPDIAENSSIVSVYRGSIPTSFITNGSAFILSSYIRAISEFSFGFVYVSLNTYILSNNSIYFAVGILNYKPLEVSVPSALPVSLSLEESIICILFVRGASCVVFPYLL